MNSTLSKQVARFSEFWERFSKDKSAVVGFAIVIVVLFMAFFGSYVAPFNPRDTRFGILSPPSIEHLLGTDTMGRDVLSRMIVGSRVTIYVGVGAAALSGLIGVAIGAFSGFMGRKIDSLLMRMTDFVLVLPVYFFYILIFAHVKSYDPTLIFTVIALLMWPTMARVVRSEFLSLKERDFVKAARQLGASDSRIIVRELLPNSMASIIIVMSMNVAYAILWSAALQFIGLGDPTSIDWAAMLNQGRSVIRSAWWLTAIPGFAIFLLVLAFNLVGDGLRDALDPRLRGA